MYSLGPGVTDSLLPQSDMAFKQKQRDEKKKLAEAQARATQKGPMGESIGEAVLTTRASFMAGVCLGCRWIRNQEKWEEMTIP